MNDENNNVNTNEMDIEKPSYVEVVKIIKRQKNGKALGEDNITAELIKYEDIEMWKRIHM